jgi:hypothetical protein
MAAPDFRIEPLDSRLRIVNPTDSARRGRDQRPHSEDEDERDVASEPTPEPESPGADPQAPRSPEPKLDILA